MKFPCRLDKFIANVGKIPRSRIKPLLKKGAVTVNGNPKVKATDAVTLDDVITLDGETLTYLGNRYFMLHKPEGYVSANSDDLHPTALDLLAEPHLEDLHIAGRLDIDTTGLVLITNDGQWSHLITSPKKDKAKVYLVETANPITDEDVSAFEQGVQLNGERHLTRPATLEILASYSARLSITEGKYHQVKRMFAARGNKVVSLHREKIGEIALDESLAPGEYRPLTQAEIDSVLS